MKIFGLNGTDTRSEWWMAQTIASILGVVAFTLGAQGKVGTTAPLIIGAVSMWVQFASTARRCAERGKSRTLALLLFVPVAGQIWATVVCGMREKANGVGSTQSQTVKSRSAWREEAEPSLSDEVIDAMLARRRAAAADLSPAPAPARPNLAANAPRPLFGPGKANPAAALRH